MPDARLDANGDLAIPTSWVWGVEAVAQRIRIRLSTWEGENPLDTRDGLPIARWLQTRPFPVGEIEAFVRREVETTRGVVSVDRLTSTFLRGSITITLEATVTADGETGTIAVSAGIASRLPGAPPVWTVRAGLRAAGVPT